MSGLTQSGVEDVLDGLLGTTGAEKTLYFALFTEDGTELSGGSYARVAITTANWRRASDQPTADNRVLIAFPIASADWVEFVSVRLMSGMTGGTEKLRAVLAMPVEVTRASQYRIGVNQFVLRFAIVTTR